MSAWDFFEHLIAVAAGRKIGCLPEVFLGEIGEPTFKGNRLLVTTPLRHGAASSSGGTTTVFSSPIVASGRSATD
jgi:hypothetical protein